MKNVMKNFYSKHYTGVLSLISGLFGLIGILGVAELYNEYIYDYIPREAEGVTVVGLVFLALVGVAMLHNILVKYHEMKVVIDRFIDQETKEEP